MIERLAEGTDHPSLSAAFTLTPKSSRNFTMWWWPAHTALWRGVMPSSLGMLGFSTLKTEIRKKIRIEILDYDGKSQKYLYQPQPFNLNPNGEHYRSEFTAKLGIVQRFLNSLEAVESHRLGVRQRQTELVLDVKHVHVSLRVSARVCSSGESVSTFVRPPSERCQG